MANVHTSVELPKPLLQRAREVAPPLREGGFSALVASLLHEHLERLGDDPPPPALTVRELIPRVLIKEGPQPATAIAKHLEVTPAAARTALRRLAAEGAVMRDTTGKWFLLEDGESRQEAAS